MSKKNNLIIKEEQIKMKTILIIIGLLVFFGWLYWKNKDFINSTYRQSRDMMHIMKQLKDREKKQQKEKLEKVIDVEEIIKKKE